MDSINRWVSLSLVSIQGTSFKFLIPSRFCFSRARVYSWGSSTSELKEESRVWISKTQGRKRVEMISGAQVVSPTTDLPSILEVTPFPRTRTHCQECLPATPSCPHGRPFIHPCPWIWYHFVKPSQLSHPTPSSSLFWKRPDSYFPDSWHCVVFKDTVCIKYNCIFFKPNLTFNLSPIQWILSCPASFYREGKVYPLLGSSVPTGTCPSQSQWLLPAYLGHRLPSLLASTKRGLSQMDSSASSRRQSLLLQSDSPQVFLRFLGSLCYTRSHQGQVKETWDALPSHSGSWELSGGCLKFLLPHHHIFPTTAECEWMLGFHLGSKAQILSDHASPNSTVDSFSRRGQRWSSGTWLIRTSLWSSCFPSDYTREAERAPIMGGRCSL